MIYLKITLMNISELKPHEKYIEERVLFLLEDMMRTGILRKPVVAENKHNVLLDGHHRFEAFKRLGLQYIPAAVVDYQDPRIVVKSWENGYIFDKDQVLRRALKGELFPPRTTRHVVQLDGRELHISEILPDVNLPLKSFKTMPLSIGERLEF
ncbi:MAG: ParB N-terminal domain-containing protein [Infirmifilum sp.]|jgi:cytosine/adenosine deaminase-related metal-dependent hydrolase|uniref:ParB-like N-terminal domain-containing protein n=1 Tax=Infirmifilum uzonense TaxID=1550241 RepID=A0A0F7FIB2_9CREN|nr:ParB N-terminal domain-containing protein [Infirmifilum uzonense]AKG38672.1 hypothetical protein MA03_04400 [Infirmifilum uzonense]